MQLCLHILRFLCECMSWLCSLLMVMWVLRGTGQCDCTNYAFLNLSFEKKCPFFRQRGIALNKKIQLTSFTLLAGSLSSFFSCFLLPLFSGAFVCSCPSNNGGRLMEMKRDKKGKNATWGISRVSVRGSGQYSEQQATRLWCSFI